MKLETYLRRQELGLGEFAQQLGVTRQAVWIWINGHGEPSRKNMRAIVDATAGMVTRRDFNVRSA